jgi:hypothetical protein
MHGDNDSDGHTFQYLPDIFLPDYVRCSGVNHPPDRRLTLAEFRVFLALCPSHGFGNRKLPKIPGGRLTFSPFWVYKGKSKNDAKKTTRKPHSSAPMPICSDIHAMFSKKLAFLAIIR